MGMLDEVKSKKKEKAAENWFKMAENAKIPEKQVEYYTRSLDSNPYNAEAWFRKGRIMEKMGNFEEAKRCFDLAIEIDPDYQGLIGRKQPDTISGDIVVREPEIGSDVGEKSFSTISNLHDDDFSGEQLPEVAMEETNDAEWVTETPQISGNAYTPPVGEESIFSNLASEAPVKEDEEDDSGKAETVDGSDIPAFGLPAEATEDQSISDENMDHEDVNVEKISLAQSTFADMSSDNAREENKEHSIFADTSAEEEAVFSDTKMTEEAKNDPDIKGDEKKMQSEPSLSTQHSSSEVHDSSSSVSAFSSQKTGSVPEPEKISKTESAPVSEIFSPSSHRSGATAKQVAGMPSSTVGANQSVDIKIPIDEILKFWAVGIVAMVIALVIGNQIMI